MHEVAVVQAAAPGMPLLGRLLPFTTHPLAPLPTCPPPSDHSVQAIGISIWASSQASGTPDQGQIRLGCGITLGGLAIQLICFVLFTVLTAWAQRHPK